MHQLWKHPNGTYYVLYGPRLKRRVSTGSRERRAAETYLAQYIAGAQETPIPDSPTIGGILDGYIEHHSAKVRSPVSMKTDVEALRPHFGELLPKSISPKIVKDYAIKRPIEYRRKRAVGAGTILREIGTLRAALAWAVTNKWLAEGEMPKIANPVKTPRPRGRWLTKDEARRLIAACQEPHIKIFVTLGLMTVARMGAMLEAKWSQVDWEHKLLDYGEGHGNKHRAVVPLNDEVFELLQAQRTLALSEFIIEYRKARVFTVKNGFSAACRRAGLTDVTPHILRHSGATWMAMAAVPMRQIARMLGDSEATAERVYAKFHPAYLDRAAGALQLSTPDCLTLKGKGAPEGALHGA